MKTHFIYSKLWGIMYSEKSAIPVTCINPVIIWNQMKNLMYSNVFLGLSTACSLMYRVTTSPVPVFRTVKRRLKNEVATP